MATRSVILLSGGVDSTVVLADRISRGYECFAVSIDYGQTHRKQELEAAAQVAAWYGVSQTVVNIAGCLAGSALTGELDIPDSHAESPDETFVPGRNLVMLSVAAGVADQFRAAEVAFGANRDDFGGYPDCRPKFITAMDAAVAIGTRNSVSVAAPLMRMSKRDVVEHGRELGVPFHLTYSCYRGTNDPCDSCGACESRNEAMR
jgi:7-cyano-7-deazaguanine synthase